jgi:hypothetical protein
MNLPFNIHQFLQVFAGYNETVWPAPIFLMALAVVAVVAVSGSSPHRNWIGSAVLAALWLWSGLVYHLVFFSQINGVAVGFGLLFVLQAGLFLWAGFARQTLVFNGRKSRARMWLGGLFIAYALAIYPWVATIADHGWPSLPSFGVPCPTTLFTFGLLLWTESLPKSLLVIPIAWAAMATSAVVQLGMYEDWGLPIAAVVVVGLLLPWQRWLGDHNASETPGHAS